MRIFENNAEMILLYLYENQNSFQKKIAQGIGINRAVVSKNLLELTREELVVQKSSSVEGFKRKMKVYSLTNNGKKEAEEKRYQINSKEVIIIEQQGRQHMIPFENAQDFLIEKMGIKFNPSTFLKHLRKSNVIDIRKTFHTKIHEQKFITERPKTDLFYGRKKEMSMVNEFIMESAKIQSIWGPTNIGKSILVSKIVEKYEDKYTIFWHKINDFSAPIYLLNHIASTLSSMNKDSLKNFLSSNNEEVEKEALDILKEELRIYPRKFIFVLDDVHKLSKDYSKFLYKLLQILKDLTKVKFIIIGKWIPYLYDETDVEQGFVRELVVEGVTWKTLKQLLESEELERIIDNKKSLQKEELKEIISSENVSRSLIELILNDLERTGQYRMIIEILPVNPHTFEQAQYLMQAHYRFCELETVEDLLRHWKRRLSSIREKIIWYSYKSKCLFKQGRREESLKVLNQGLQLLKKISDVKLTVDLNIQLILHKIKQGDFSEASTILKTLEAISKESKQPNQVGLILIYKGWILESKGMLDQSLKIYLQTLSLFEKSGNPLYIVNSFNKIAKIYSEYNQLDIALEYHKKTLKLLNHNGTPFEKSAIINNIASIYSNNGKLDLALNYYNEALRFKKHIGNPQSIAITLHNIALVLQKQGELDNSLTYSKRALEIGTQIGYRKLIALSQMNIGLIYYLHGQIDNALKYYYQTLEILEDIEDPYYLSALLNDLGLIYSTQGNFEQALVYFNRTLKLGELIDNPCLIAEVIFNIACVHAKKRVLTDKLPILARFPSAPYQSHITQAFKLMLMALLNEREESWVEAAKTWKQALEVEGLVFGYKILCRQQLVELSYRKWLANKSEINYKSLIKKLDVWEEFCKTKNIPQGLCQIYLIRAKLNMIEFQFKEAERLLELCKTTSVEIGHQTYSKLAEKEWINLQSQLQKILLVSNRARKDCDNKNK